MAQAFAGQKDPVSTTFEKKSREIAENARRALAEARANGELPSSTAKKPETTFTIRYSSEGEPLNEYPESDCRMTAGEWSAICGRLGWTIVEERSTPQATPPAAEKAAPKTLEPASNVNEAGPPASEWTIDGVPANEVPLRITEYTSHFDQSPKTVNTTWGRHVDRQSQCREVDCPSETLFTVEETAADGTTSTTKTIKTVAPICPSLTPHPTTGERLPNKCSERAGEAWSPVVTNGRRGDANVEGMTAVTLDLDHLKKTERDRVLSKGVDLGWAMAIESTHSHNPDRDDHCYRLSVPTKRELAPAEIEPTRDWVQAQLGMRADEKTKNRERLYYRPTRPRRGGPPFFQATVSGNSIEPVTTPAKTDKPIGIPVAPSSSGPADLSALKKALKPGKYTQPGTAALIERVLSEEKLAEAGERDDSVHTAAGYIGWKIPNASIEAQLGIMRPSVMKMDPPERGDWFSIAREKLERAHDRWVEWMEQRRNAQAAERDSYLPPGATTAERPKVVMGSEVDRIISASEKHLADREPGLFMNAGRIVRIDKSGCFVRVGPNQLNQLLSRNVDFRNPATPGKEEGGSVAPPRYVAETLHERGCPHLPVIDRLSRCPLVRADGSLASGIGFDNATGFYMLADFDLPPMPERPTQADARAAREVLERIVSGFPFETVEAKAAWLASVLTPFARALYSGNTPAVLINARDQGTGKTLLAIASVALAEGEIVGTYTYAGETELRKTLYSYALEGRRDLIIDNFDDGYCLVSRSLASTLTSERIEQRNLHANTIGKPRVQFQVYLTGNNITVNRDLARRALFIRLDAGMENPAGRDFSKQPDLVPSVLEHRAELVAACLTILRAYVLAGMPPMGVKPFGSFESWSRVVGGTVMFSGAADPTLVRGESEKSVKADDDDTNTCRQLHAAFSKADPEGKGITAKDLLDKVRSAGTEEFIREATKTPKGELVSSKSVGRLIATFEKRVRDGMRLERGSTNDTGTQLWLVKAVTP